MSGQGGAQFRIDVGPRCLLVMVAQHRVGRPSQPGEWREHGLQRSAVGFVGEVARDHDGIGLQRIDAVDQAPQVRRVLVNAQVDVTDQHEPQRGAGSVKHGLLYPDALRLDETCPCEQQANCKQ